MMQRLELMGEERMAAAAKRVVSGDTTKAPQVPVDKAGFPKVLCLDTKIWIELARIYYYGTKSDERPKAALLAIVEAVSSGKVVVPVFTTNLDEVAEASDEARRERLACFMVDISGNVSALPWSEAEEGELHNAISRLFLGREETKRTREQMLRPGMIAAYGRRLEVSGGDPFLAAVVTESMLSPEVSVVEMVSAMDRRSVEAARSIDREGWKRVEQIRRNDAAMTTQERRRLEYSNLWAETRGDRLEYALRSLGVGIEGFRSWLDTDEHLVEFWASVPAVDVLATLMFARDQNPDHATHHNDGKDFSFLQVAIPYGNAVVTEKSWAHLAQRTKLTEKYDVKVIGNTREIPRVLAEMGCI
jgi:hypothetical protein